MEKVIDEREWLSFIFVDAGTQEREVTPKPPPFVSLLATLQLTKGLVTALSQKKVLETERAANADPVDDGAQNDIAEEEELFPPQYLEVEHILACDESEMDMKVMAKQRALNILTEQEALRFELQMIGSKCYAKHV